MNTKLILIVISFGVSTGMFLFLSVQGVEEEKSSGSACIFCHTEYQGRKELYQHKPFYEKKCQACHTEFHGDNPRPEAVRRGDLELEIEVCWTCHQEKNLGESHPVGANILDVKRGTSMTCISCHMPHWSDFKYILKQEEKAELCLGCHPELR